MARKVEDFVVCWPLRGQPIYVDDESDVLDCFDVSNGFDLISPGKFGSGRSVCARYRVTTTALTTTSHFALETPKHV
jgi:hypothetical protein